MNWLSIVFICGIAISTLAAPQNESSDLNIRNRRRVPSSSYTRTQEGVQVAIPGLEVTTDIITTTDINTGEGVTDLGNTEDNNSLTEEKVHTPEKDLSTPSSHQGDSGVKHAASSTTTEKTSTVTNEPTLSTTTASKKEQSSFFSKGPLGLPIPNPFAGLKIQPKLPAVPTGIPNIFGR